MKPKRRPPSKDQAAPWYRGAQIPLRVIRRYARRVAERFQPEKILLFGSYAYGSPHADSDVDLLVSFQEKPTFSGYMKLRIFLEDLLGTRVDLVTESGLREAVRPYVEKDAIRVA